jgi:multidrug efflux pump subunit AcrA (membrane-fusion protein)
MPVRIVLDAYPNTTYTGRVSEISAVAQESTRASMRRAFRVLVKLDKIEPARMRPGLSARVVIRREERANALLIPRGCVILSEAKDLPPGRRGSFAVSAAQDDRESSK